MSSKEKSKVSSPKSRATSLPKTKAASPASNPPKLVFTFGRFQPPHVGHALLIKQVLAEAKRTGADHCIVVSASCNKAWVGSKLQKRQQTERIFESCKQNENPLKIESRLKYLRLMFPSVSFLGADGKLGNNIFSVITHFKEEKGYADITAMFGSDRAPVMRDLFAKYDLNVDVKSAGKRDDAADDVTGASATKMREAAVRGGLDDIKYFVDHAMGQCNGTAMTLSDALAMMKEVRDSLGVSEGGASGACGAGGAITILHKPRPLKYKLKPDEKPPRKQR